MSNHQNSPILHFRKELGAPPVAKSTANVAIRTIEVPRDLPTWLQLRDRAIVELRPTPRSWTTADFQAEMLSKSWWQADRCWIAEVRESAHASGTMIGSVTLAERMGKHGSVPVVHWLIVDPTWRRHGIGCLLMTHLERTAWEAGHREIQLETHAGWNAAVAFYQSIGYAPARDPSPR